MRGLPLLALLLAAGSCDEGVRAFRAGDARAALDAFERRIAADGGAAAEWHYDRALAALHCGEWHAVEEGAAAALERGGREFGGRVAFLRGCAAALGGEEAARQAALPGAIPADWDLAIARGRGAVDAFARALEARERDWPEARRNAARALLKLREWEERRRAADPAREEPKPLPLPEPARLEELLERMERDREAPRAPPPAPSVERDW